MKKIIETLDKKIKILIAVAVVINMVAVCILLIPSGDRSKIEAVIYSFDAGSAADPSSCYGSAGTDLNGNGILEHTKMGMGYTSGVHSFIIYVEEGEDSYSRIFISYRHSSSPSFVVKDGDLYVRFVSPAGEPEEDYLLIFRDGNLGLIDENGESFS